jgi:polyphosphate kinase
MELINPISQIIKTKVYDEIIKTFLNKNITTFSIENNESVKNTISTTNSEETITESESTVNYPRLKSEASKA